MACSCSFCCVAADVAPPAEQRWRESEEISTGPHPRTRDSHAPRWLFRLTDGTRARSHPEAATVPAACEFRSSQRSRTAPFPSAEDGRSGCSELAVGRFARGGRDVEVCQSDRFAGRQQHTLVGELGKSSSKLTRKLTLLARERSAPCESSVRTMSACPAAAARCSAVSPDTTFCVFAPFAS